MRLLNPSGYLSLRRLVFSALTAIALLMLTSSDALASHFRYATISAQPVLNDAGQPTGLMTFKITSAWRRSAFGALVKGNTFQPENFFFGDGGSQLLTMTVTSFSSAEDWVIGETTLSHQYVGAAASTFTAFGSSSGRVANLNNGANAAWRYETLVRPFTTNHSPTAAMPPIVSVPKSAAAQFFVTASDIDIDPLTGKRDTLTYKMATAAQAGVGTNPVPTGFSINPATGLVTWNNNTLDAVNFWFAQVIIEDHDAATGLVKSSIPVDVLLKIVTVTSLAPLTRIDGLSTPKTISVQAGSPVTFAIAADDPDGAVPVSLTASGMPGLATLSPNMPFSGTAPITSTFTWTPQAADAGSRTINFTTTDNTGLAVSNSVNIFIENNIAPTIAGPARLTSSFDPPAPIHVSVADANGDPLTVEWRLDGALVRSDSVPASQDPTPLAFPGPYGAAGPHTVTARVTDSKGASCVLTVGVTVVQAAQSIDFRPLQTRALGAPAFAVSATASSNLPVSFSVLSGPATIAGNLVTVTGLGTVTIRASQGGDPNFLAATPVDQSFDVVDLDVTSITFETRYYAPPQAPPLDTADAIARWNGLPAGVAGYAPGPRTLTIFDNVSNAVTFGGVTSNLGYHHHFAFDAPVGGTLAIRMGADFGFGGTLVIDGQEIEFRANDMWWNGNYLAASQYLKGTVTIAAGPHVIDSYGFEDCCDGVQQAQYSYLGADYKTFTSPANFVPVVAVTGPAVVAPNSTSQYDFTVTDPDTVPPASFSVIDLSCGVNGTQSGPATITAAGGSFLCAFTGAPSVVSAQVMDNRRAISNLATLNVKFSQSIAFAPLAGKTYGDADFAVTATASSNLPVSYAASGTCTVTGSSVHIVSAGNCTITASQAGDASFSAAAPVSQSFAIARAEAVIAVNGYSGVYDGAAHGATGTASGVGEEDLASLLTLGASFTNVPGGTAHWSFAGNTNYAPASGDAAIVITPADATFVHSGYSGVYDAAPHGATVTATGVGGVPLTGVTNTETFTNVPGGTAHWTFANAPNYNPASGSDAIVITPATAQITVQGYTGVYDGHAHGATGTATGLGGLDLSALLNLGASFTNVPGGTARWTFAGNGNYDAAAGTAAIALTRAALTVTADDKSKLLGAALPVFTARYSPFQGTDGPASLTGALTFSTTATAASPAGTYPIVPSGLSSGNYAITFANGTLNVTYNVSIAYDDTKGHNSGSTVPIKLQLCNAAGVVHGATNLVVHAIGLVRLSSRAAGAVEDAGQANPDDNFRLVGPGASYMFNLKTTGLTTGTYDLVFTVTGDPQTHAVKFQIR